MDKPVLVSCGGGGVFIFWQLGAAQAILKYLQAKRVIWCGSSAGSVCAAIMLCNICPEKAIGSAYAIAGKYGAFSRSTGLYGILGHIVREWLEDILPENAALICGEGSLTVQVSAWTGWRQGFKIERVSEFKDRNYLIDVLMASCHVPWYLDGRTFARLELGSAGMSVPVCDGALGWFLPFRRILGLSTADLKLRGKHGEKPNYRVSQTHDQVFMKDAKSFCSMVDHEASLAMMERGYNFTMERLKRDE